MSEAAAISSFDVQTAMKEANLVPNIIDNAPSGLIEIKYGENAVSLGNKLTPTEVKEAPTSLHWENWDSDPNKFHTLVMIDPDAPSKMLPILRSVKHWLVGNIPGGDLTKGQTLTEYKGSGPPHGSGFHRYLFLIFAQPERLDFSEMLNRSENRTNFSIKKFGKTYNLGDPVAGNFFLAEWDSSVATLMQRIKARKLV